MKKVLIILIIMSVFLSFSFVDVYAAKPIVEIEQMPKGKDKKNKKVLASKLIEYYNNANKLAVQLDYLGVEDIPKIPAIDADLVKKVKYRDVGKYYKLAKGFEKKVIETNVILCAEKNAKLQDSIADMKVEHINNLAKNKSIARANSLEEQEKLFESFYSGTYTLKSLSIGIAENLPLFNNVDNLTSNPNLSVRIALNTSKITGFLSNTEFWYEYQEPNIKTKENIAGIDIEHDWDLKMHQAGFSAQTPKLVLFGVSHYLEGSIGYYWLSGNKYNIGNSSVENKGILLGANYIISNLSFYNHFDITLGGNLMLGDNELIFYTMQNKIEAETINITLRLGFKYHLWR